MGKDEEADNREWVIVRKHGTDAIGFDATIADTILNVMPTLPDGTPLYVVNGEQKTRIENVPRTIAILDMPPDAQPFAFALDGATLMPGEDWRGCTLTMVGIFTETPDTSGPLVRVHVDALDTDQRVYLQVWLAYVTSDRTKARADYRWHPERGVQMSIRGLEHATLQGDRLSIPQMKRESNAVMRGFAVIRKVLITGPKAGNTYALPDHDPECVARAYYEIFDATPGDKKRPSQETVALHLGTSKPTVNKYRQRHGIPWPPARPQNS